MWVLKKLHLGWGAASSQRVNDINEVYEFCLKVYESSALCKKTMKNYDNQKIEKHELLIGFMVFLLNSRLCFFPGRLKSMWTAPFIVTQVFAHGAVELEKKKGIRFKVNRQRIKAYMGKEECVQEEVEAYYIDEV